jgi:hypothetical protein
MTVARTNLLEERISGFKDFSFVTPKRFLQQNLPTAEVARHGGNFWKNVG